MADADSRAALFSILTSRFSKDELDELCVLLKVDPDTLRSDTRDNKATDLFLYLERRGRLPELVAAGRQIRDDIDWPKMAIEPQDAPQTPLTPREAPSAAAASSPARPAIWRSIPKPLLLVAAGLVIVAVVVFVMSSLAPGLAARPTAAPLAAATSTPGAAGPVTPVPAQPVAAAPSPTATPAPASPSPTQAPPPAQGVAAPTLSPTAAAGQASSGGAALASSAQPGVISPANAAQVAQVDVQEYSMGVKRVAWSPHPASGNLLAIANNDVYLYDPAARKVITDFGIANWTEALAFTADGSTLAAAVYNATTLLNVDGGGALRSLAGTTAAHAAAFSPDGALLALTVGQTVKVFEVGNGRELATLPAGPDQVEAVAFSPLAAPGGEKGYLLAAGGHDIEIWRVAAGASWEGATPSPMGDAINRVQALAFSPGGALLAAGTGDGKIRLWDPVKRTAARLFQGGDNNTGGVRELAFSPDGALVVSASGDPVVRLWDAASGRLLRTLTGHTSGVGTVSFSPDGKLFASGDGGSLRIWGLPSPGPGGTATPTPRPVSTLAPMPAAANAITTGNVERVAQADVREGSPVKELAWSPHPNDGNLLAVAINDLYLYDPAARKVTVDFGIQNWVEAVAFSPDGAAVAATTMTEPAKLLGVETGGELRSLPATSGGNAAAFSPDGALLALAVGQTVKVFDVGSGRELATLPAGPDQVEAVAFSPAAAPGGEKGYLLAAGGHDIEVWRVAAGASWERADPAVIGDPYTGSQALAFSPEGALLASGASDGKIRLWDPANGAAVRTLPGHKSGVRALAFAPGGGLLASSAYEPGIALWDVASGKLLRTLTGHTAAVEALAFSPDGAWLASGGEDSTLRLWGVK